jgi:hypothetical protein
MRMLMVGSSQSVASRKAKAERKLIGASQAITSGQSEWSG